jgi:signal peptidase I
VLYRNGSPVPEPYLHSSLPRLTYGRDIAPVEIGPSEYFVLGDFRDNSRDSRMFGPVSGQQFVGRVELIGFSFGEGIVRWDRFPVHFAYSP